jgi:hypothetical protein
MFALVIAVLDGCKSAKTSSIQQAVGGGQYYWITGSAPNHPSLCRLKNEMDQYTDAEIDEKKMPDGTTYRQNILAQCIGQETWYKATGGGARFHAYTSPQRQGILIDFNQMLRTEARYTRFANWGTINDPQCCSPGQDCEAKNMKIGGQPVTLANTFGWDYCVGDETLLKYVGHPEMDYTTADPACDLKNVEGARPNQENSCFLEFGTSSGSMNLRKFPNPRFDAEVWNKIGKWEGYGKRLDDGSIEPPFMVAQSCGTCHISFDPINPPSNPENPSYENILGAAGSQFMQITEIFTNGLKKKDLLYQIGVHQRPGVVDTSAVTQDMVNNPGTPNAILNLGKRPGLERDDQHKPAFPETFSKWVNVGANVNCSEAEKEASTCVTVKSGTWRYERMTDSIPHVLKGGEDAIGPAGSVQRVYLNIFSCTETCVSNSLSDLFVFQGRNFQQTPVDIGECRQDCPGFRAVEDRVGDIFQFLSHVRPRKLQDAQDAKIRTNPVKGDATESEKIAAKAEADKRLADATALVNTMYAQGVIPEATPYIDGPSLVKAIKDHPDYKVGQTVFLQKCAGCHSNRSELATAGRIEPLRRHMFAPGADGSFKDLRVDEDGVAADWFGSDVRLPQPAIGTYKCRAMHSNHAKDHLWEFYGSENLRKQEAPAGFADLSHPNVPANGEADGRGYYRAISLLNLWATAPLMHNNAMGPELKKGPGSELNVGVAEIWKSVPKDPSVVARLKLYRASMHQLLYPESRDHTTTTGNFGRYMKGKVILTDVPIEITLFPSISSALTMFSNTAAAGLATLGFDTDSFAKIASYRPGIPAGTSISVLGSIKHKELLLALLAELRKVAAEYPGVAQTAQRINAQTKRMASFLAAFNANGNPAELEKWLTLNHFTSCGSEAIGGTDMQPPLENQGHEGEGFGTKLGQKEKEALINFLMTI